MLTTNSMTEKTPLMQNIQARLIRELRIEDPQVQVRVKRTSLGWLEIKIVTSCFEEHALAEREQKIDDILAGIDFHLSKFPILGYNLLTPKEAANQPPELIQLPFWSDILMAPPPDRASEENPNKPPLLVTFYSFRGGVGRYTALGLVAGILASRKHRVVMLDFDLESPGLSNLLRADVKIINEEQLGVLDYLHQRFLTPELNVPTIDHCICQVKLPDRGELFLVPVGEYDENYIHRLADLDRGTWQAFYQRERNPVKQLIADTACSLFN